MRRFLTRVTVAVAVAAALAAPSLSPAGTLDIQGHGKSGPAIMCC
jgi:hypothetical protein